MTQGDRLSLECARCRKETQHQVYVKENTAANVVINAQCTECGNTITVPVAGSYHFTSSDNLAEQFRALVSANSRRPTKL